MKSFWDGFEKRSVSVAWIKKMTDKGLLSRFKKQHPHNASPWEDITERADKNYLKGTARGSSDRMHWDMSPDRDALRSAVKSLNRETKADPERTGRALRYARKYPGYLHGLRTDTHAPWKHDPQWAAEDRKVQDFIMHGEKAPYTGLKLVSGGKK